MHSPKWLSFQKQKQRPDNIVVDGKTKQIEITFTDSKGTN
jgi:hypothetical protein